MKIFIVNDQDQQTNIISNLIINKYFKIKNKICIFEDIYTTKSDDDCPEQQYLDISCSNHMTDHKD